MVLQCCSIPIGSFLTMMGCLVLLLLSTHDNVTAPRGGVSAWSTTTMTTPFKSSSIIYRQRSILRPFYGTNLYYQPRQRVLLKASRKTSSLTPKETYFSPLPKDAVMLPRECIKAFCHICFDIVPIILLSFGCASFPYDNAAMAYVINSEENNVKIRIHEDNTETITTIMNSVGMGDAGGGAINLDSIRQSLVSPTEDTPQIMLPSIKSGTSTTDSSPSLSKKLPQKSKSPILQGMVYLLNNNNRPEFNDYIVLTISSTSDPENVLAGAKYSVSKAKFPFNFVMYDANVVKGKEDEWKSFINGIGNEIGGNADYVVTARVCPEDSAKLPCPEEESTFYATSISKLLNIDNLPGANKGDIIRTAVSLRLQPTK